MNSLSCIMAIAHLVLVGNTDVKKVQEKPKAVVAIDPAMETLGKLVGGKWISVGDFVAEFTYEWRVPGKSIRAVGIIAKGTPNEIPSEAIYGWDEAAHKVYYMDFHNFDTVYKGWGESKDGKFMGDFEGIVGDKGHYRFEAVLPDKDTLISTLLGKDKDGKWAPLHSLTFKRHFAAFK